VWFATNALDLSEDEAFEAVSYDGANDKGLDFIYIDHEQGKVILCQGKYNQSLRVNIKESHFNSLQTSVNWLSSPEALRRDGKAELAEAASDYIDAIKDGYGTELWFVYSGSRNANIEKSVEVYNRNQENIDSSRSIRHCALEELRATWLENYEQAARRVGDVTLTFPEGKCFTFSGSFGEAAVVSLSAVELATIYEKYGDILFDRNVRLFLGNRKGSVNAGIAATLQKDEGQSKSFT
jgi:hypothetical protein